MTSEKPDPSRLPAAPAADHSTLADVVAHFLARRARRESPPDSVTAAFGMDADGRPAVLVSTWQDGERTGQSRVAI